MNDAEISGLPGVHSFVQGPRKDLPAVTASLTLPYSNGPMEGTNTKVKLLNRQIEAPFNI